MGTLVVALMLVAAVVPPADPAVASQLPSWQRLAVPVSTIFHGLSAVDRRIAWLGGSEGQILRTADGGQHWDDVAPPGVGRLQFRDIEAFSADRAVAMGLGAGSEARFYVTGDGGHSWQVSYENPEPTAYYSCMSFSDNLHGLALADPVTGKFRVLSTRDGGSSWSVLPDNGMPPSPVHEYSFAASGECITTLGTDAWFGSGGKDAARVFHSADGGLTWDVTSTSFPTRPFGGIFAVAFRTQQVGIAVGGNAFRPDRDVNVAEITSGGGMWRKAAVGPTGFRAGVAFVPGTAHTAITVGLNGSDISYDDGNHWTHFADGSFATVDCASDGSCWAAGPHGRVALLHR